MCWGFGRKSPDVQCDNFAWICSFFFLWPLVPDPLFSLHFATAIVLDFLLVQMVSLGVFLHFARHFIGWHRMTMACNLDKSGERGKKGTGTRGERKQ